MHALARLLALALLSIGASGCVSTGSDAEAQQAAADAGVQPCDAPDPTEVRYADKPSGTAWFVPRPPHYPAFTSRETVTRYAKCVSEALEDYIGAWFDGAVPATIPRAFLPRGTNFEDFPSFRLVRPENIEPREQWAIREAHAIDHDALYGAFPDPNATYLVLPALYAPFGSRVVIEAEFPHARYFSAQITPSFDPRNYRYDGGIGVGEVPIVDADIEPLPGHVNPFRPGADRSAQRRSYRLRFDLGTGDPVVLNPSFRPPAFREPGNRRVGSGIMYQGAWGVSSEGHGRGAWDVGQLWLRYYAPDRGAGALGGVPLPKVHFELPDGRAYYIAPDLGPFRERVNATVDAPEQRRHATPGQDPFNGHPESGWYKQTGIFRSIVSGIAMRTDWAGPDYVQSLTRGVAGRGSDMDPPRDYEQSATSATHIDYLVRGMSREADHVVALSGKLPTYPATRGGNPTMTAAELRYFSIVGYYVPTGWDALGYVFSGDPPGLAVHEIMDAEIVLNEQREYLIVLSSPEDRPANATADNGVTWIDWGPYGSISWTLRWMSVAPHWAAAFTPSPERLGRRLDWAAPGFDPTSVEYDNRDLRHAEYFPRLHYLPTAAFEAMADRELVDTFVAAKQWP